VRRSPQWNRIGIVRPNAVHADVSPKSSPRVTGSGVGRGSGPASSKYCRQKNRRAPGPGGGRLSRRGGSESAVAKPVRGAFPLRHIVGDYAGGFHRGLAELGIAGDFALDALAFGMQQVAQAFQFANQVFDFRERGSGDALDQRVDVVDGGLGAGLQRRGLRRSASADGADRRRRCGRNRGCRPRPPRPRRDWSPLQGDVNFFGTNGSVHRLFPCFACVASADCPPHDEIPSTPIRAADFDRIGANMRQCSIFHGKGRNPKRRCHQLRRTGVTSCA